MSFVFGVLYLALYVYGGLVNYRLYTKAGINHAWLAWVPIAQMAPLLWTIRRSAWMMLWMLVPIANVVFAVIWMVKFLNAFGYSGWWILLLLVPYVGELGYMALTSYMAFSQKVEYQW